MIFWQRVIYYLGLALVEATPPALVLTLLGADAWGMLIGVALLGALTDWIVLRRLPPERQSLALGGAGLACALWVVKGQVVGDYGLLGDWGQALGAIFSVSHPRAAIAYLSLLTALYCFWRGTRLTQHDSGSMHRVFRAVAISLLLIVGLGFFGMRLSGPTGIAASTQVLTFFAVGLITVALASASEDRDSDLRRLGWRGMLILCAAVALVLGLGMLVVSLFGGEIAQVVTLLWHGVVLIIALIFVPLLLLMVTILERLIDLSNLDQLLRQWAQQVQQQQQNQQQPSAVGEAWVNFPPWVQASIRIFFALLPILFILGLLLLARRRRQRGKDEERESLLSWGSLADDLRGLLAHMRKPSREGGLRGALSRLRGGDPIHRIRRSYIRLLLVGEARNRARAAPQTPREYTPTASAMLPGVAQPIDALTGAYERARYFPTGASAADAELAERAWQAIDQADRRDR